jgi:hypothetical protein
MNVPDHEVSVLSCSIEPVRFIDTELLCRIERDHLERILFRYASIFHHFAASSSAAHSSSESEFIETTTPFFQRIYPL